MPAYRTSLRRAATGGLRAAAVAMALAVAAPSALAQDAAWCSIHDEACVVFAEANTTAAAIDDARTRATAQAIVAGALADAGLFVNAVTIAKGIESIERQVHALTLIAVAHARAGAVTDAAAGFAAARTRALGIEDTIVQSDALNLLIDGQRDAVALYADAGLEQAAIDVLSAAAEDARAQQRFGAGPGLVRVMRGWLLIGRFEDAQALVVDITDNGRRAGALRLIAEAQSTAGMTDAAAKSFAAAHALAAEIIDAGTRVGVVTTIIGEQAATGFSAEALVSAEGFEDTRRRDGAFAAIAIELAADGRFAEAAAIVDSIATPYHRAVALGTIAAHQAADGQQADADDSLAAALVAVDAAAALSDTALVSISAAYLRLGLTTQAREVADRIETPFSRALELSQVAMAATRAGRLDEADAAFAAARDVAETIESARVRERTRARIAGRQAAAGLIKAAQATAMLIDDPDHRDSAGIAIATALADAGRFREARSVADGLQTPLDRDRALLNIVAAQTAAALAMGGLMP